MNYRYIVIEEILLYSLWLWTGKKPDSGMLPLLSPSPFFLLRYRKEGWKRKGSTERVVSEEEDDEEVEGRGTEPHGPGKWEGAGSSRLRSTVVQW